MPIGGVMGDKGPNQMILVKPGLDMWVGADIEVIINIDEIKSHNRPVYEDHGCDERDGHEEYLRGTSHQNSATGKHKRTPAIRRLPECGEAKWLNCKSTGLPRDSVMCLDEKVSRSFPNTWKQIEAKQRKNGLTHSA
jgi:hypothetical protein